MAIYHLSTNHISRSSGRSSIAAAAYRSGCELVDNRTGLVHDYTQKSGVIHSEIMTQKGQTIDRQTLWNKAEEAENRKDARTAREWRIALPSELNTNQQIQLTKDFSQELIKRYGVAVDFAIHQPDRQGDDRNYHAHILVTTRQVEINERGELELGKKASIELGDKDRKKIGLHSGKDEIKEVRQLWENQTNRALERAGSHERINCKSLKDQGIDREPTIKEGYKARLMERAGEVSERCQTNREIKKDNLQRKKLKAEILELKEYRQQQQVQIYERMETAMQQLPIKDGQQYLKELQTMRQVDFLNDDPEYKKSQHQLEQQEKGITQFVENRYKVQHEIEDYEQQHKIKTKLHKTGFLKDKVLTEQYARLNQFDQKIEHARAILKDSQEQHETIEQEALKRVEPNYQQHKEHAARIEKILQEKRLNEAREIGQQEQQNSRPREKARQKGKDYYRER